MKTKCKTKLSINPEYIASRRYNCNRGFGFRCGPIVELTFECEGIPMRLVNKNLNNNSDYVEGYLFEGNNKLQIFFPNINMENLGLDNDEEFELAEDDLFANLLNERNLPVYEGFFKPVETNIGLLIVIQ